jgi:hypothetical protein
MTAVRKIEPAWAWVERLADDELREAHSAVLSAFYRRFRTNVGRPREGSRVEALATMAVGEDKLFGFIQACRITGHTRNCARKWLRNPEAQWSARSTNKGLRVTRTA